MQRNSHTTSISVASHRHTNHINPTTAMSAKSSPTKNAEVEKKTEETPDVTKEEEDTSPSGTTEVWDSKKQQAFVESGELDTLTFTITPNSASSTLPLHRPPSALSTRSSVSVRGTHTHARTHERTRTHTHARALH